MKILIDTNILIDLLTKREPFFENARQIMLSCTEGRIDGCIAAHSVSNIFYILRREISEKERRKILKNLCLILTVVEIDRKKLINALDNIHFKDMEDCL